MKINSWDAESWDEQYVISATENIKIWHRFKGKHFVKAMTNRRSANTLRSLWKPSNKLQYQVIQ